MRFLWTLIGIGLLVVLFEFLPLSQTTKMISKALFLFGGVSTIYVASTRLAQTNRKLRATSERLEDVISNLKDGVVVYDEDFTVHMFNEAAEHIFKVKKDDVIGKKIGPEMVEQKEFRFLTQTIFPSLAPRSIQRTETGAYPQVTDVIFSDPEKWIRTFTNPLRDEVGGRITFMKTIEDRTREVQLQRSKSQFITVAAHQLRTPLTAIQWTFELLAGSETIAPEDKKAVTDGMEVSAKVLKIVNDLLDVSKMEEGRFGYELKEIDMVPFLEDMVRKAIPIAKQYSVKMYFDKKIQSATVTIDPDKIGMAVSNFIDNAIKYNVENGDVIVTVLPVENEPYIEVRIKDTGVGIPPKDIESLFTKFFRADNVTTVHTEGTGLGLYIAKNIIERHGGTVWVESVLKRGTTFYFRIPTDPSLIPPKEVGMAA